MASTDSAAITKTEASANPSHVKALPKRKHDSDLPSSPLAFTDAQLDTIMKHAMPLHPRLRRAFVEHVAVALRGQTVGAGSLHRACAKVLKEMFDPPLETSHESKWAR